MIKPGSILPKQKSIVPTRGGDPFYSSRRWRKVRKIKIMNDPLCEECLLANITTAADEVDHIKPRKPTAYSGPEPAQGWGEDLAIDNLRSLCKPHHARKSRGDRRVFEGVGGINP